MDDETVLDALIEAGGAILGLPIEPAWRPSVRFHLALSLRMAAAVEGFTLPDEAEPAPVFQA